MTAIRFDDIVNSPLNKTQGNVSSESMMAAIRGENCQERPAPEITLHIDIRSYDSYGGVSNLRATFTRKRIWRQSTRGSGTTCPE